MTLPTFLGIGVLRGGTSWLYELLNSHPDIYMPTHRKEVFYFDLNYERGLDWYQAFFPADEDAGRYKAMGEITATYLYHPKASERISRVPSITKLILIVRNPVNRAYSHYGLLVKNGEYTGKFDDFLSDRPQVIEKGFYSRFLENYFCCFDRDQILVMIYEQVVNDIYKTKKTLACFLGVTVERFPEDAGIKRVNRSYLPRVPFAYSLARKVAWDFLRHKWELDWIVNWGKRLGIERLFGEAGSLPPMSEESRKYLIELYQDEIGKLESLLQLDLECWR
jgi:hypothetical protein